MQPPIKTILFSTLYPSAARPSHGIFVETRLRQLLGSGEVTTQVVAPVPWFPFRARRFGEWAVMAATPASEFRNGIQVWHPRYALPPKIGMSIAPIMLALGARATISRLIRDQGDFDLFDAHYYYPDVVAAAFLAKWFDKPLVSTARGTDLNLLPDFRIPRAWIRWAGSKAARSITVSNALMTRLIELGVDATHISVLRNGVDLELFRPLDRQACRRKLGLTEGRWILSVGHLLANKGHDIAIDALRYLPVDLKLAIVGAGAEHAALTRFASRLGLSGRVVFAGSRAQDELKEWYSAADVLVLCSSREGWPNVLLESLACGTPVVATRVGGVPEVIELPIAGRLIDDRTADALASSVLELLASDVDRDAVRAYASAFDWSATTRGQIDLFRKVTCGRTR